MALKKLSEIDLELDRLQAELERCGTEQQALDAQKLAIKDKMAAARLKSLLEERVFQQRAWRLLFWFDGSYRLQEYPPLDAWDEIDALLETAGTGWKVLIPLPGGVTAMFRLTCEGEYVFEIPDADQVIGVVQALGLTVVGLGALEDDVKAQQATLDQRRAALARFTQAFGGPAENIDALLAKVPTEIRIATKPLGSDRCWAALILLLDNDAGLRIGDLEQNLGGNRSEILLVMRALTRAGLASLVAPTFEDIGSLDTSYYRASLLGKSLVRGLYCSILPQSDGKMRP